MNRNNVMLSGLMGLCFFAFSMNTQSQAQQYTVKKGQNRAFAKVTDDPKLPRVLIIGDSISIGYTPALRELLKGKANVHRIPTNGGPTTKGLKSIEAWLGDGNYDVIHFNWGLHDLKFVGKDGKNIAPENGQYQVTLKQYKENLSQLVAAMQKTDAKLIWRNTTPVPADCPWRIESDEIAYNEVASEIMQKNDIPTDDHHSYVIKHMSEIQRPANVHFTPQGSKKLAELAAVAILKELNKPSK